MTTRLSSFIMIQQRLYTLLKNGNFSIQVRSIKTTTVSPLIQKWRIERGLPMNPNATGVLVNSPDYSFTDGRMTPYGTRQKNRILRQRELRDQIITLTGEVDFAVDRYNRLQKEEEDKRKRIVDAKLKPKGLNLLKSK